MGDYQSPILGKKYQKEYQEEIIIKDLQINKICNGINLTESKYHGINNFIVDSRNVQKGDAPMAAQENIRNKRRKQ